MRLHLLFWEEMTELFVSNGFNTDKASVLYSSLKQKILNALISKSLKNITARLWTREERKGIFQHSFIIFLSNIDRKEEINQHCNKVNISPADCLISFIESFSKKKEKFNPSFLNSTDKDLRKLQFEMLHVVFRQMAEYSNNNLNRNADFLLVKSNKKVNNIPWARASKQRFDSSLYKLTYWTHWHT